MKASYYTCNKTFAVEPIEAVAPGPGEVAIDVAYCGLCGTDLHVYHGNMDMRVGCHRIIGHEMSGTVSAVGDGVDDLNAGDKVVVRPLVSCGEQVVWSAVLGDFSPRLVDVDGRGYSFVLIDPGATK